MMEFAESFEHEADEVMDGVLADSDNSPTLTPFVSLGSDDPARAILDGPTNARQASANDLFQAFDDGTPSVERMKRIGLHHDEAFEL